MFANSETTSNLYHQLIQREANDLNHGQSKSFGSHVFRERYRLAKNLYKTDFKGHFGCVNAIEFSHGGQFLASGGDDKRVLVWDIEKSIANIEPPRVLATEHASNIFCLSFDSKNQKLLSGGNDDLVLSHNFDTGKLDNVFKHDQPVYGLSIDPQNDSIFATASENGVILVFDQRTDPADPLTVASVTSSFHAVEFHPSISHLLVTANSKRGAALYDIRKPKQPVLQYGNLGNLENHRSCMSVRFNRSGNLILGLRRRLPPILYNVNSPDPICTFYHSNYYNSCTMKSCTFAGEDDELVISGSDDFNLYVWRLTDIDLEGTEQWVETTQMVLYGHRSIVNQVRYNREKCLLASSGVEKVVKIWSPFSQPNWTGSLLQEAISSDNPRELYSPYNLFTMALPENWHHLSHDYSSENTNEDPRMMAFFDSLIQQEIEEWDSNSSSSTSALSHSSHESNSSSSSSSSTSATGSSISEDSTSDSSSSSSTSSSSSSSSSGNSKKSSLIGTTTRRGSSNSSSSSSSSSSSDGGNSDKQINNNKNNNLITKNRKRHQRHKKQRPLLALKKIQRKHRNHLKSRIPAKKYKSSHSRPPSLKPTNRIAFLISTKRDTLRRLAIKGAASTGNRRPHRLVLVINQRRKTSSAAGTQSRRIVASTSHKRKKHNNKNNNNNNSGIEKPTTSAAAAAAASSLSSVSKHHHHKAQKRKTSKQKNSTAPEENTENQLTPNAAPSTIATNTTSSSNDVNEPSTSTGITSSFRDAFLRLRRQIFMSDSEEEEAEANTNRNKTNNLLGESTSHNNNNNNNKRQNGANKINKCETTSMGHTDTRRLRSYQTPKNSAALNIPTAAAAASPPTTTGNSNTTEQYQQLPQMIQTTGNIDYADRDDDDDDEDDDDIGNEYPSCSKRCKSPNKRLHKSSLSKSASASPLKKRRLSIADFISKKRNHRTDDANQNHNDEVPQEEDNNNNNNETNINDIFNGTTQLITADSNQHQHHPGQLTPLRPNLNNNSSSITNNNNNNNTNHTIYNNNSYLYTPDSGVSLNSMTTPSTIDQNDSLYGAASTSSSRRVVSNLSPCFETDDNCDDDDDDAAAADNTRINNNLDDEGVVVNRNCSRKRNRKITFDNKFHEKVNRLRRNYRKQFANDSDSD